MLLYSDFLIIKKNNVDFDFNNNIDFILIK